MKIFFTTHHRIKVIGRENIPSEGGVLLCSNHHSNLDPPLIGVTSARELSFMAKSELFKIPVFGPLLKTLNAFPIKRGASDRQAIKLASQLLKDGHTLLLFPEGSRNKSKELGTGLSGAGFFALRTDAVVIPCAIMTSYKMFTPITVIYGKPIDMSSLKEKKTKPMEATQVIMSHIQELITNYSVE